MSVTASRTSGSSPGFEEVRVRRGERSGAAMAIAVHRTVGGRALGGCRMWSYASTTDAVRDAERLARSMSYKAAAAGLPLGGAKAVIALPDGAPAAGRRREQMLRDFAELVESFRGRYITAQDAGTSLEDMVYLSRFTDHVAGHPIADGGSGDPSPYTAHGVEVGIRASAGRPLAGIHVVVIGIGHVGGSLLAVYSRPERG